MGALTDLLLQGAQSGMALRTALNVSQATFSRLVAAASSGAMRRDAIELSLDMSVSKAAWNFAISPGKWAIKSPNWNG